MMQHQPIVKRVNGTHEWAQALSAPIKFQIQIQIQNSLLFPIYSFGHTYIQFVFKYNNIHNSWKFAQASVC